jgi:alkylation response protein AidB-like acyl-CoA dehydrogenase
LLEFERFSMSGSARAKRMLRELKVLAAAAPSVSPVIEDRLARLAIELLALEYMELRLLSRMNAGENPGPEASKLKIRGTEIAQEITRLRLDLTGPDSLPFDATFLDGEGDAPFGRGAAGGAVAAYLNQRKLTIWGGSNEVQRMILARQVLGLG